MHRTLASFPLRLAGAALCLALISCAQQPVAPARPAPAAGATRASPPPQAPTAAIPGSTPATPRVDPGVLEALDRMGAFLRTLKYFDVAVESSTDEILDNDQLAQVGKSARLKVRRPDGLQADFWDDAGNRRVLYYNGKAASLYDPETKFYATVQAPPTLGELIRVLGDRYGIELPATDLFWWGTDRINSSTITSADYLGPARVDGILTDHFALRENGFDWQIWIEQGRTPVPRKLVITTTSDPARPQYAVALRWNLSPKSPAGAFTFKAPAGSQRIVIQKADGTLDTTR